LGEKDFAMVPVLRAAVLCAALVVAPASAMASEGDVERLAREGAEKFVEALETLIERMPRYEMPEITDEGDIIIRRRDPGTAPPPDRAGDGAVERI
jgi:hypothetical protein